jgi:Tumour-associated protein
MLHTTYVFPRDDASHNSCFTLPDFNIPPPSPSPSDTISSQLGATLYQISIESTPEKYYFTLDRSLLNISPQTRFAYNITAHNITIATDHACFGSPFLNYIVHNFVGYDTIFINELRRLFGEGFLKNQLTRDIFPCSLDQSYIQRSSIGQMFIFKAELLSTVCFLFFAITALVSFTLRQTQVRMLQFTAQLRHNIRTRTPFGWLIIRHILESLAFVPGAVGILFFLFEFFNDQLLGVCILLLAWISELYTAISVRTRISMMFYPRIYGLYFFIFGIYFFSFPSGFHYLALLNFILFLAHAMLYFGNRHEVAAVISGQISTENPRMLHPAQVFSVLPNGGLASSAQRLAHRHNHNDAYAPHAAPIAAAAPAHSASPDASPVRQRRPATSPSPVTSTLSRRQQIQSSPLIATVQSRDRTATTPAATATTTMATTTTTTTATATTATSVTGSSSPSASFSFTPTSIGIGSSTHTDSARLRRRYMGRPHQHADSVWSEADENKHNSSAIPPRPAPPLNRAIQSFDYSHLPHHHQPQPRHQHQHHSSLNVEALDPDDEEGYDVVDF